MEATNLNGDLIAHVMRNKRVGRLIRSSTPRLLLISAVFFLSSFPSYAQELPRSSSRVDAEDNHAFVVEAKQIVAKATRETVQWNGPSTGPPAPKGKVIALVTEDLRNGGIIGVAQGAREAAIAMEWTLKVFDGGGTSSGRTKALGDALAIKPDGLVLCGSDAVENNSALAAFAGLGSPVVGWHTAAQSGPVAGTPLAMNVTSEPIKVAQLAALAAVAQSDGHAGVVILTDSKYSIATAKAKAMEEIIRACKDCTLLEVRDVALADSSERMPAITNQLLRQYGKRWTHTLAINDLYFDYAITALTAAGIPADGLSLISAGDGSASAFLRIQAKTYQTATVAEPLNQQGWQVMDELNRLIVGQVVSGFVAPIHLVNVDSTGAAGSRNFQYDPENGYRDRYRKIWNP
ncbi:MULTISPECIES: substrate-binding domain-containing protein [unclassified Pseudomonas]|uniref:substrate-binding domain-containing protein n=1 Tax=unclassified Pseudomonas TaxID=196821 RepID=UPI002B22E1D6|nr:MULTISPECIES: substrate-binding domain-containing protein [unclassified Pseudomonas]MEA9975755.1 substrate-binding domain-containing protein [Pseudomonas sp. RTS4]MEB0197544.1 substrate-binding domain-containing protein [Pseudomonas sp. 5S4]MEB0244969.1 substrate-binding domain-containing protein [Pseudomonas sp. 10S5]